MNQCSDAVWRLATEIMEANKKKDDTVDAVAEKLHMFSHVTQQEGQSLAEGKAPGGAECFVSCEYSCIPCPCFCANINLATDA